ncbi:hypothetical protein CK203_019860 [Vitis vinifera]|uniref:tRNA (adenine(58)-N(1))-methyltransferase non-catalytic subunit TRM6 n=1 Tax=Vitis vinifera TaxID=29760 RepID=A0A438J2Y9_VITVI|nr:hypothetical protein CK203_019860 [Vitis vinifera]
MSQNSLQKDSIQNPRVTWEGCSVLLDINDGDRLVFARLSAAACIIAMVKKNDMLRVMVFFDLFAEFSLSGNDLQETQDCQLKDEPKDNRAIVDNNKAQSLTGEDIDEMRR